MKPLYDGDAKLIGHYHFMKNANEYGIRFSEDNYYADITLSIDAFPEYRKQFGFYTETEIWELKLG